MDLANALHINSWLETAKTEARGKGCKVWLVRDGGGFKIVDSKPQKPTAEIYPGARVVIWEK